MVLVGPNTDEDLWDPPKSGSVHDHVSLGVCVMYWLFQSRKRMHLPDQQSQHQASNPKGSEILWTSCKSCPSPSLCCRHPFPTCIAQGKFNFKRHVIVFSLRFHWPWDTVYVYPTHISSLFLQCLDPFQCKLCGLAGIVMEGWDLDFEVLQITVAERCFSHCIGFSLRPLPEMLEHCSLIYQVWQLLIQPFDKCFYIRNLFVGCILHLPCDILNELFLCFNIWLNLLWNR